MKSLYPNQKQLNAEQNLFLSKRIREQGDLRSRTKMIEGNAGFAYKRAMKYAAMNSGWSHIDDDDILQAAMVGLIEAVDRYDPDKKGKDDRSYAFTTFAHFWIIRRVNEEIWHRHWNTMRPPRKEMREFLYRKMSYDSSGDYVKQYMSKGGDKVSSSPEQGDAYSWAEIMIAVRAAKLDIHEKRVFDSLYGDNPKQDDLSDLTRGQIGDIEFTMLEKIKEQL